MGEPVSSVKVEDKPGDNRRTVDVQVILSKNLGAVVDRIARAVEYTSEHVFCHG